MPPEARSNVIETLYLSEAYLCEDCQCIMRVNEHGRCTICNGDAVLSLYRVLNREAK